MQAPTPSLRRSARLAAVMLASAGLLLSGCGEDAATNTATTPTPTLTSESPTPSGVTSTNVTQRPAPNPDATEVMVTETEFKLALSAKKFKAGDYVFMYSNAGKVPHNIALKGPGVDEPGTAAVSPGQSGELRVTLQKGTYELWCAVGDHKGRGMDTTITVG